MTSRTRTIHACHKSAARSLLDEARRGHSLHNAKHCRAWRLAGGLKTITEAKSIELGNAETLDDALAAVSALNHKDTLFILEVDEGRNVSILHAWRIRQGALTYRRNAATGLSEPYRPMKPDPLFSLPVNAFDPKRPFNAFLEPASGVDPELVEQSQ